MPNNHETVKRPAMLIKSQLPDNLNEAFSQAMAYARELERVWAPKVTAYMDQQDRDIKTLRDCVLFAKGYFDAEIESARDDKVRVAFRTALEAKMVQFDAALKETANADS